MTLGAYGQTQVNAPHHTDGATKHYALVNRYPQEADQAYRRPELVTVLHHRPQLIHAVRLDNIHGIHARLALRIDIAHVRQKHERVHNSAKGLVEDEFDEDIGLAERRLSAVWFGTWLFGCRGRRGHVRGKLVF